MRAILEAAVFGALALAAHGAVLMAPVAGAPAGRTGAGGREAVTLAAADPALAALAQEWERAPAVAPSPRAGAAPPGAAPPALPGTDAVPASMSAPEAPAPPTPPQRSGPVPAAPAPLRLARPEIAAPAAPAAPSVDEASGGARDEAARDVSAAQGPAPQGRVVAPSADLPPQAMSATPPRPAFPGATAFAPDASPRPAAMPRRPDPPAAAPARPPAAASAESRAAGAGLARSGAAAGREGAAPGAMDAWRAAVGQAVRAGLRRPRGTGRVGLRLTVDTGGRITGAQVAASSGDARLDAAAARAAMAVRRVPAAPAGAPSGTYGFTLTVELR